VSESEEWALRRELDRSSRTAPRRALRQQENSYPGSCVRCGLYCGARRGILKPTRADGGKRLFHKECA
jgi:hypothetical protein